MARRRGDDGGFEPTPRQNPFDMLDQEDTPESYDLDDSFEDDTYADDPNLEEDRMDEFDGDPEGYEDEEYAAPGGLRGFLSSVQGKVLAIAVALLLVILIGVIIWRVFFFGQKKPAEPSLPEAGISDGLPSQGDQTQTVFGPGGDEDSYPDDGPTSVFNKQDEDEDGSQSAPLVFGPIGDDEPTAEPEPEDTALPIILTNTPTPSPTQAPSPSPTPSPDPSASPTPSPTPKIDIGTGKTNRSANLRSSMSATASVKKTVKKGETVTIHEAVLDSENKLWYALTVDDISTEGWMRDYVVDLNGELSKPVSTIAAQSSGTSVATTVSSLPAGVLATGKTNKDANVRKVMNGQVVTQLRKNHKVEILDVRKDKNGYTWYQIRTAGGTTGFVRNYLINLDKGMVLPSAEDSSTSPAQSSSATLTPSAATATPTPTPTPKPTPTPVKTPIPTVAVEGSVSMASAPPAQSTAEIPLEQRVVIGTAKTNRDANVRDKPAANGRLVRQLSKGIELKILAQLETNGDIWYEVVTTSGKTHGYVRDYVIQITGINNMTAPASAYTNGDGEG